MIIDSKSYELLKFVAPSWAGDPPTMRDCTRCENPQPSSGLSKRPLMSFLTIVSAIAPKQTKNSFLSISFKIGQQLLFLLRKWTLTTDKQ